jgi:hypothetical protein
MEDGVEQSIAAFATDSVPGASALIAATERASSGDVPASTPAADSRGHTFVICIYSMHSAFANSTRTREALTRLFEKEKATGAQYVLMSIGRQLQVVQTATSDLAVVLSKLRNPSVQPALGGGDAATLKSELDDLKKRMYDLCRRCPCGSNTGYRACDTET